MDRRDFLKLCTAALGSTCIPKLPDFDLQTASPLQNGSTNLNKVRRRCRRLITIEEMKSLPKPTADQQRLFVEHVSHAHNWCKHLSLLTGGRFVVFLASDAGENCPTRHPYANTTEDYRKAFGHLDYMYSTQLGYKSIYFSREAGSSEVRFASGFMRGFSFVLYPYVENMCGCFLLPEMHIEAYIALYRGSYHPQRERLFELVDVTSEWFGVTAGLSDEEYDIIAGVVGVPSSHTQLKQKRKYAKLEKQQRAIRADLRNQELAKIAAAVRRLQAL